MNTNDLIKKDLIKEFENYDPRLSNQPTITEIYKNIAAKYNVHPERVRKHHRMLKDKNKIRCIDTSNESKQLSYKKDAKEFISYTNDDIKASKLTNKRINNEKELYEEFGVNPAIWELVRWDCKTWDAWIKNRDEEIETQPVYSVSASFRKIKVESNLEAQKLAVIEEFKKNAPQKFIVKENYKNNFDEDNLLLISLFDIHFGKLAHRDESGDDYDIKIAENRFKAALNSLLSRVNLSTIDRILFPIGNDLINVDNFGSTTTSGTLQDTDTRFHKLIKTVNRVLIETINSLMAIAPVDVLIVPGNHDRLSTFMVGCTLEAYYHNTEMVNIENKPTLRKYYKYGKNGFQFTHGNEEKHEALGLIFATEQPKLWANTDFRFCQLGHYHKNKKINYVSVDEHQGFQVQILPSLSSNDAWHAMKGYNSLRQAKAFLYNKDEGLIGEFTYTLKNI